MASRSWHRYSTRFVSAVAALVAAVSVHGERARACGGWGGPSYFDFMTFDPSITGDADGVYFDPMVIGFGGACTECAQKAMVADWHGYFNGKVADTDWKKLLFPENQNESVAIRNKLANKGDRVRDALAYLDLAQ